MKRSHIRVYVHYVWATWDRQPLIPAGARERLYAVIRAACEKLRCEVLAVGGMPDHVHLLIALPATATIADVAHDAKGASSRWMNEEADLPDHFQCQGRYGAISVSPHERSKVIAYIQNQERHHADGSTWRNAEEIPDEDADDESR